MTNNEARERLIKIICEGCKKGIESIADNCDGELANCKVLNNVADALLAEGVIVPKFKIGQEVFVVSGTWSTGWIYFKDTISEIVVVENHDIWYRAKDNIGLIPEERIFTTVEEAREVLREEQK